MVMAEAVTRIISPFAVFQVMASFQVRWFVCCNLRRVITFALVNQLLLTVQSVMYVGGMVVNKFLVIHSFVRIPPYNKLNALHNSIFLDPIAYCCFCFSHCQVISQKDFHQFNVSINHMECQSFLMPVIIWKLEVCVSCRLQ